METSLDFQINQFLDEIQSELNCTEDTAKDILAKALHQNSGEIFLTLNEIYIGESKK